MIDAIILVSILVVVGCLVFWVKKHSNKVRKEMIQEIEDEQNSSN